MAMAEHPAEPDLDELPAETRPRADSADRPLGDFTPRLTRIALALGVPAQDAADVVQDTLLAAHRARRSFDPGRGALETWLATILLHRTRNGRRTERRQRALRALLGTVLPSREPRGTRDIDRVEARLTLERLLSCLSDSQREVVALYEIGELPADDVARALGHTPAGVRSIARDARNKLAGAARGPVRQEGSRR